jgi:dipeptidyl aminopeptidase/acylaminoacyl peptidase
MHGMKVLPLLALLFLPLAAWAEPKLAYSPYEAADHGSRVRSAAGKIIRKLPALHDPAISPDGKQVVATQFLPKGRRLVIVDVATGKQRVLPVEGREIYGGLWSPKGDWIAFQILGERWGVGMVR